MQMIGTDFALKNMCFEVVLPFRPLYVCGSLLLGLVPILYIMLPQLLSTPPVTTYTCYHCCCCFHVCVGKGGDRREGR